MRNCWIKATTITDVAFTGSANGSSVSGTVTGNGTVVFVCQSDKWPPEAATLITPANHAAMIQACPPPLVWSNSVPAATWFHLYVTINQIPCVDQWIEGATNWPSGMDLPSGSYVWWGQTWNPDGYGPWSTNSSFSFQRPPVGKLALVSPSGALNAGANIRYTWGADTNATWYELYGLRNGTLFCDKWYALTNSMVDSATGHFAVDLGGHANGSYQWYVRGWSPDGFGPWSSAGTFTIASCVPSALVPIMPMGIVAASSAQRYLWKADPCATWYELYVVQNGKVLCDKWVALSNSVADSATGNFAVDVSGHTGGNYQWYVRGWSPDGLGSWSGLGSFTMNPPPAPGPVTLLTPTNNAAVQVRQAEFTWTASDPAADWYYLYLVRNGSKYAEQWVAGVTNWVATNGLPGGAYTWHVCPWNAAGYGPWSASSSFTIQSAAPGVITLVSPSGSVASGSTQRYVWKADAATTWYELYVLRANSVFGDKWYALTNSVADSGTGNFAVDVSGHGSGTYQWWVRGWGPDGLGLWSSGLTFQVP